MAVLEILKDDHPILNQPTKMVEKITPKIKKLISDMIETMEANDGVGLAANQVGQGLAIFVTSHKRYPVLINALVGRDVNAKKVLLNEGCLSRSGFLREVQRWDSISVYFLDLDGNSVTININSIWDGSFGHVCQHEFDHLKGIPFQRMGVVD